MSIDGTVTLAVNANDRRTVGINTGANLPANFTPSQSFTNGSGAGQANVLYQGQLSLSAGTYNVDLNGILTDSYGTLVSLLRVKAIIFQNNSASNPMTLGAGTNPWITFLNSTGTITLPAGAAIAAFTPDATGWGVLAATGDILKVVGTGTDQFTIIVLGASS